MTDMPLAHASATHDAWTLVDEKADARPDLNEYALARELVDELSLEALRALASQEIVTHVWARRRAQAVTVEKAATAGASAEPTVAAAPSFRERVLASPSITDTPGQKRERARFKRMLGDDFDDWYDAALAAARETGVSSERIEWFREDWNPDLRETRRLHQLSAILTPALEQFKRSIRLELTAELLGTEFAIGDGTRVTWGEATRDQHQARVQRQMDHAAGTIEDAARHAAAIDMLDEAGVATLSELKAA